VVAAGDEQRDLAATERSRHREGEPTVGVDQLGLEVGDQPPQAEHCDRIWERRLVALRAPAGEKPDRGAELADPEVIGRDQDPHRRDQD
jgi:hypothetical protein